MTVAREPRLFDPRATQEPCCPRCHATRPDDCQHNADNAGLRLADRPRRPRGCIAAPGPGPLPESF